MGRPKKDLEEVSFDGWELLEEIVPFATEEHCADRLGMSISTLVRRIKERYGLTFDEFKAKKTEGIKTQLRQAQFELAVKDKNATMAIFLGKNMLGQSDKVEGNHNIKQTFEQVIKDMESNYDGED